MKWSKLPKEKRKQLVLVAVGTVAALWGLGFGLIKAQRDGLARAATEQAKAEAKLQEMRQALKRAAVVEASLAEANQALAGREVSLATGDLYSWMVNTIRKFQKDYGSNVQIPQLSPISSQGPVEVLPEIPYQQARMQVGGSARYHELGRFVADLENAYPLMRVANLSLELNRSPAPGDREKLAFKMDLITLVKPSQP